MNRQRMTWGGKSATGPVLPVEEAARKAAEAKRASAHPQTPDEGITHPAGYPDPTQPAAYENGDTSSWAEDPHPGPYRTSPAPAVPVDDGGYKHPATQPGAPAKNASDLRVAVEHKAAKCLRIASAVLGSEITAAAEAGDKVATSMIEDQALDFMDLPDARLAATLRRLEAAKEDPEKLLRKMLAGEDGEEVEEEEEEEEVEETASKKSASDDKLAEVMSMLAGLQAQLAEMKAGGGHKAEAPVDAEEAMLAEMMKEEAKKAEAPVDAEAEAEAMLQAMLAEEAKMAEAPAVAEAPAKAEAPVEAGKSLAQYLEDDMDISMDAIDDPMGLLGDPMLQGGDDEVLASLFASDVKVAKKAEDEEEVEEEGDDAAEGEDEEIEDEAAEEDAGKKAAVAKAAADAKLRPQPKKAGAGAKTVGTQVRTAGARSDIDELSKIWESAPDVRKAFQG